MSTTQHLLVALLVFLLGFAAAEEDTWQPAEISGYSNVEQKSLRGDATLAVSCRNGIFEITLSDRALKSLKISTPVFYRVDSGKWTPGFKLIDMEGNYRLAVAAGKAAKKMLPAFFSGKQLEFRAGDRVMGPFRVYGLKANREYYPC